MALFLTCIAEPISFPICVDRCGHFAAHDSDFVTLKYSA